MPSKKVVIQYPPGTFPVAANLVINLAFLLSHPIFTPCYTVPIAMLSLWSLLFAPLMQPAEIVDDRLVRQATRA